jgi:glucokinase
VETATPENFSPPFFVGVDVGGTNIKVGIVDDRGHTIGFTNFSTQSHLSPEVAIADVNEAIDALSRETSIPLTDLTSIGLGTPGTMDISKGIILEPTNLPGWRHYPIRDELTRSSGKPVTYANDGAAAAYGEFWVGSAKDQASIVMLTLGTGVGGGIIIDGKSLDGQTSHGAECGHVIIDSSPMARKCSCGLRGHLEAYASATALVQRCEEKIQQGEKSSLAASIERGEAISGLSIAQAAENKDELAETLILETADYLAIAISILMNTIDPSAVILGGAMNFGGESNPVGKLFIQRVRSTARKLALPVVGESVLIEFAELGGNAGYIGAAGLAREEFYRSRELSLAD